MQIKNRARTSIDNVSFVFQTVHHLFHFGALLSIRDDHPSYRPITPENIRAISLENRDTQEESKGNNTSRSSKDLRILGVTWNTATTEKNLFEN